jgi:DNA polymerase-3 subunit epsilon
MYLIIDTETTGLPEMPGFDQYYPITDHDKYDSSRLVQIAWMVLDKEFNEKWSENYIVKRDNFSIDNSEFHNITNEMSDVHGVPLNVIFEHLYSSLIECETIVAHNLSFDENVILNHTHRINDKLLRDRWLSMERLCTMKMGKDVLKLPRKNGYYGYKYPKLQELYRYYYGDDFEGAHDAMNDVVACADCFKKITR